MTVSFLKLLTKSAFNNFFKKPGFHSFATFNARQRVLLATDMVPTLSELSSLDCWESMILGEHKN